MRRTRPDLRQTGPRPEPKHYFSVDSAMTDQPGRGGATPEEGVSPAAQRVVSFTDAVVAVAITLVFPLTDARLTDAGLAGQLLALWPQLRSFTLSFLIVGLFWLHHYAMFVLVLFLPSIPVALVSPLAAHVMWWLYLPAYWLVGRQLR